MLFLAASDAIQTPDFVNSIGIPALGFFSVIIGGLSAVWIETIKARRRASEAKEVASATLANTESTGNGFAQKVLDRLERIETTQRRFEDGLLSHLEYHLAVRPNDDTRKEGN